MINTTVFEKNQTINLKENEQLTIYQDLNSQVDTLNIDLKDNSSLEVMLYNSSAKVNCEVSENTNLTIYNIAFINDEYHIDLNVNANGTGANIHIVNVYLGIEDAKMTSDMMIKHLAKGTTCLLETYAISKNNANLVLNNNALIKQGMSKTDTRQMTKGLNLSESASIKAQPNLFIDEYDVVASHSASIGSIDKEDLFYLMSRGLSESKAQEIVVLGFIEPILANIKNEELQKDIYNKFANLLK